MLADELVGVLQHHHPGAEVTQRDLLDGLPLLDEEMIGAFFTPEGDRNEAQRSIIATSEALVAELEQADEVVVALPIYNFHVPAAFKAWIDLVARARRTFRYTPTGPEGLLADRPVTIILTSGGTRLHGPADFLTGWLRHVFGFLGLRDVRFVEADGLMGDAGGRLASARAQIAARSASSAA